jgi:hypothetical protein
VWLTKSSIPPWGWGGENDLLGTVQLPTGEFVLIGSHYVDASVSTTVMLKGLGGFVQTLMSQDMTKMEPLSVESTLMGFSTEPTGVRTITEIALWGLTSAVQPEDSTAGKQPLLHGFSSDLSQGRIDIAVRVPRSVFADRGVDPDVDEEGARRIVREWNEAKLVEVRRLLRIPSPD